VLGIQDKTHFEFHPNGWMGGKIGEVMEVNDMSVN